MKSIAFVFPGQGSQTVGMGRELAQASQEAAGVFQAADDALGFPLSRLCFEGPAEELNLTANTQPAILTCSIAAWRAIGGRLLEPALVAGHSLGEYSALVAAGSLDFADAVKIVRRRGEFMQQAVPVGVGAMAAVLGLDEPAIARICAGVEGFVVSPANFNGPGQTVIAGHREGVEAASRLALEQGASRVLPLPVSAPFHCSLMEPAERNLAPLLQATTFRNLSVPLVCNVDSRIVEEGDDARDCLVRQVSKPVRWLQSVELMAEKGIAEFIELGPGKVLSGLIRRIARQSRTVSVDAPPAVQAVLEGR